VASGCGGGGESVSAPPRAPAGLTFRAPFADGATIPARYTCAGRGERPALLMGRVPSDARELVLVVTDPDAPGGTFVHWTAYGIPPRTVTLPGRRAHQGRNSAGGIGWTPPCPPKGDRPHRYVFSVYALRAPSGLEQGTEPGDVIGALDGAIASGRVVGRFGR